MESEVITLQDIFHAKPPDEETAASGPSRLLSPLLCTGLKPHFLDKMAAHGRPVAELLQRGAVRLPVEPRRCDFGGFS